MLQRFNNPYREQSHRMLPEVARDEPQPQGPMRVAVVVEGPPGGPQRGRVSPVPLRVGRRQSGRRDARAVLLAEEQIAVHHGRVRLEFHGPPVVGRRLFDLALVLQGVAQTEIGFGQWGRLPTCRKGGVSGRLATCAMIFRRRQLDGAAVLLDGPVALPQAEKEFAELEVRLGRRSLGDGPLVERNGLASAAEFLQQRGTAASGHRRAAGAVRGPCGCWPRPPRRTPTPHAPCPG